MRLLKLQIVVAAVAFLFGALKGLSFVGGYYQTSFLLSLYASSIVFLMAFALTKTKIYLVIEYRDSRTLTGLCGVAIGLWTTMLLLHLYYSDSCGGAESCNELQVRDFLINGIIWVFIPLVYLFRKFRIQFLRASAILAFLLVLYIMVAVPSFRDQSKAAIYFSIAGGLLLYTVLVFFGARFYERRTSARKAAHDRDNQS